jgi:hypothetical protein
MSSISGRMLRLATAMATAGVALSLELSAGQTAPPLQLAQQLSILRFTLGKSTLDDVRHVLGASAGKRCTKEQVSVRGMCYVSSAPSSGGPATILVFESSGTVLEGYKMMSEPREACERDCRR